MSDFAANESSYPNPFFYFLLSLHLVTQSLSYVWSSKSLPVSEVIKCALQQHFWSQRRLEPMYCKRLEFAAVYNIFILILCDA